ncbi:hypothetical protein [Streptomyces silvensis]|nr:hypothetical protein [Streptomyces silvensis]
MRTAGLVIFVLTTALTLAALAMAVTSHRPADAVGLVALAGLLASGAYGTGRRLFKG